MPSFSKRVTASRLATALLLAGGAGASSLLLSCTDQTGPGEPVPGRFALVPRFESDVAGIVTLAHARFVLTRVPDGAVATDTVIDIAAGQDSVDLTLVVPLLHATETFALRIALVTPAGDTAFRAGPLDVQPVATGPVPQISITLRYTGIGANAMRVVCLYDSVPVFAGDVTLMTAVARDSADAEIAGTPVGWRSLDTAVARFADPGVGAVTGVAPGTALVVAELLTGQADTALVIVSLPPVNVLADSGTGQTGTTGSELPETLVARVVASDGSGVPGQLVRFVVASGGGSLSADSVLTDSAGRARTRWTLGPVAGSQIVQATTPRLPGVTATFSATSTAGTVGGIAIVAGDGQSGLVGTTLPLAPSVRVTDAQSNPIAGIPVAFAVTSGGGAVNGGSQVTDVNGMATADSWILGSAVGINTLTVTADTLTPVLFTALATGPGGAMSMVLNAGNGQTGLAGTALPVMPSVLVRDTANNVVAGVAVTFTAILGGGSAAPPAPLTDAGGIASAAWTLGAPGNNELAASLAGLADVVFQATGTVGPADTVVVISGNAQTDTAGLPLALPLVVEVRDSVGNPVAGIAVNWTTFNGSIAPPTTVTDGAGQAQAGWTLGTNAVNQAATAQVSGLTPAVFTATAVYPNPTVLLALAGTDRVRLSDSALLNVSLSAPAPVGGTVVNLSVDNGAVLGLDTADVFIPETGTTTQTRVYGLSSGTTTVRGNATGYSEGATAILVTVQVLSMPTTLNVGYGGTASLPLQISSPAPVGGVDVTVVSDNPAAVGVQAPTVTIPEGQQTANAVLVGVAPGTATITATTVDFGAAQTSAATTANLNIIEGSAAFAQTFNDTLTVRLESSGAPIAAPGPGIPVTFTARDPACLAATSPVTIPTGLVSVNTVITYGGTATTPCTTYLVAEAAGISADSLSVTVNPPPGITVYQYTLAAGTHRYADGYLGVTNHGGVNVVIKSSSPGSLLIAPDANTVGGDSVVRFVPNGNNYFTYYIQAFEGVADTGVTNVGVTVTATGFTAAAQTHVVRRLAYQLESVPATTTTLSDSTAFYVQVGYQILPSYPYLYEAQSIRPGGQPLTITIVNDTAAVGDLVKSGGVRGDTLTVQIPVGTYYSPTSVAAGGIAFDPVNAGTATLTASAPGADPTTYATRPIAVSAPGITVYQYNVGSGLHRYADGYLGATNHGGVDVVIKSSDPALLVSPDATTPGTDSVVRFVANGQNYFTYYIQALEGSADTGVVSAPVTVTAPGFVSAGQTHFVRPMSFQMEGVPGTLTTLSDSVAFYVQVGYQIPPSYPYLYEPQSIRPGGQPLTVTIVNDSLAVGDLVQSGGVRGDTLTVQIPVGTYYSPTSVAAGGIAFDPMAAGTASLTASIVGGQPTTYATRSVTVSAPGITIYQYNVGGGLHRYADGYLGASNHGGVDVVVRSATPGALLLSPNSTTVGADTVAIFVPNGSNYYTYYIQGIEGVADTGVVSVPVTVTAPGFTPAAQTHLVHRTAFDIVGLPGSTTTLSDSAPFYAQIGYTTAGYPGLLEVQSLRPGAPALDVTLAVGTPGVGRLTTQSLTGDTVTVQVPAGSYYSPTSVATGGVAFDPLTSGTTTVFGIVTGYDQAATRSVTVTSPGITMYEITVGAGLQKSTYGYLAASNHGGVNVVVKSSAAGVARLSPDAATVGDDSVVVFVPDGQNYFYYYAQGVEGQTGTVTATARATGFTDGSAPINIVQPAVGVYSLPGSVSAAGDSVAFYAQVGIPYSANQYLSEVQFVRAGGTPLTVTLTNSNLAVADLVTQLAGRADTVTVTIPIGLYYSPTTVATGGAAFKGTAAGTTVVSGAIPGFITLVYDGQRTVTVTP